MTDEFFDYFLNDMGFAPAIDCHSIDDNIFRKFHEKLPDRLLEYWQTYGFCGYGEGLFWTVNPEDYEDLLEKWLGDTPLWGRENFHVVARTAFGELYVRGEKSITTTIIDPHLCNILPGDAPDEIIPKENMDRCIGIFFEAKSKKSTDYNDQNDKPLFKRALKKLGPLKHDEMYSFIPALAVGGAASIENLQIVKIHEQLALLADLDTPVMLKSVNELFSTTEES